VPSSYLRDYEANGYALVPGVFTGAEVASMAAEFDRFKAEASRHHRSFRHGNILYVIENDSGRGPTLRYMQWPAYISPVLAEFRVDTRLGDLLEPLIGNDLKQIINQLIWKIPGAQSGRYAFHQDCRFRRPRECFRELESSYIQTAIAIDAHDERSGGLSFYPGSHRLGDLRLGLDHAVIGNADDSPTLLRHGLRPEDRVAIRLEPGDVALWSPFAVHGSGDNRSATERRAYANAYVKAGCCDRGEWAFRAGRPCPLGTPVLVQYDDLCVRPEPHYVDGDPFPVSGE
jgi:ectoine hydroxylase-related dioxygenase (phytanoyl-CoA dioxygenase family)